MSASRKNVIAFPYSRPPQEQGPDNGRREIDRLRDHGTALYRALKQIKRQERLALTRFQAAIERERQGARSPRII